jgi:demethylmenaquinone methyltransferase/2-methoxy-6-polyprenyl-1,4-benzoquinol methylase
MTPATRTLPDRRRSLESYARHASRYDATCSRIHGIRAAAIEALALRPGDVVFDVACGTGATLAPLAQRVGPGGRVVGVEHCPEMAAIARARAPANAEVVLSGVEELHAPLRADAMLLSYTHDVLQSPSAVRRLAHHAMPGCRVAVAGIRFLPWWYGWPVNLVMAWRSRPYITTYSGLRRPFALLEPYCFDFRLVRTFHAGSSYLGVGTFR